MKADFEIINAKLPVYENLQRISLRDGKIASLAPMSESQSVSNCPILDVAGDWISLGGVDLQINGGLGLPFPELERQHLPLLAKICEFLWQQGVDAFLPTIVTTSVEKIQRSLSLISEFTSKTSPEAAQILGVHLEGPFLNPEKRGAHPAKYLLPLNLENVKKILGDDAEIVKIITLAPELEPTGEVISYLKSFGITVSLGHSLATETQAQQAFQQGATMVTHAFNAMPSLHHRQPGLLGAALTNPNVKCGFIADGKHVSPTMLQILLRAANYEQGLFLVSDALAPIGLAEGVYPWDNREIAIKNGTAKLEDGTLAGTTLPLLVGVENLVKWGICGIREAIATATESPRNAIGLTGISPGKPATLLRWHFDPQTSKLTWERLLGIGDW
ncbi:MAG: N-acetylglucosamine-6-phosphate deacetylase [Oscillatoria sp. PMC 1068.18]|nr:N-acetylglucosamine-6-phosphate deacetylase [Oscillatoria sp. PMC 1076.18]MEC4989420.1 N-acetylglucosamine-6-phosphate deacetylase [Oscillatoria sp. PMC 1068.18]